MRRLDGANAVLVAHNLNPSIFTQCWLDRNGIVTEDDLGSGYVFSDNLVHAETGAFALTVVPNRLQLDIVDPDGDVGQVVRSKIGAVLELLPHTPYQAVGLNFQFRVVMEVGAGFPEIDRDHFAKADSPVYSEFGSDDARFGAYLSKDAFGGRFRLDIKPINGVEDGKQFEGLAYTFNLHRNLSDTEATTEIREVLTDWDEVRATCRRIFEESTAWGGA